MQQLREAGFTQLLHEWLQRDFSQQYRFSRRKPAQRRNTPHRRDMSRLMPLTTITIKPFAPQIQYRFLCSRRPMTKTTFSAPLARSFPRVASPEAVFFPAAAIQLSARIALLRRAKARWILFGGFPGSAFPVQSRGFQARQGVTRWQFDLRGMRSGLYANPLPRGSHPLFL